MFWRKVIDHLVEWSKRRERKPLVLRGARQVGKTTAVAMLSDQFDQYLYFNLENREERSIFEQKLSFSDLLRAVYFVKNKSRVKGSTLLFLDEIQSSPGAMSYLRSFYEGAADIHLITAGSLLEVLLKDQTSGFPVGRIEYLFMYPLSFEEYLRAMGEDGALQLYHTIPIPAYGYEPLMRHFHNYVFVGGMPEIVRIYSELRDLVELRSIYQGLLTSFTDDVGKYSRNPTMNQVMRHVIETAPLEAGKRIKFQGFGRSNYRSREAGEALRTLERAMLIQLVYPTSCSTPPIIPDLKKSPRLQYLDSGLLNFFAGLQDFYFKMDDLHSFYQGLIAQHAVGQELIALDATTHRRISFWVREKKPSTAEIDFLFPFGQILVPIEVKAGKTGTLRSLHQFMDETNHSIAVRLYSGQMRRDEVRTRAGKRFSLLSLPYFLTGKLHNYLEWFTV